MPVLAPLKHYWSWATFSTLVLGWVTARENHNVCWSLVLNCAGAFLDWWSHSTGLGPHSGDVTSLIISYVNMAIRPYVINGHIHLVIIGLLRYSTKNVAIWLKQCLNWTKVGKKANMARDHIFLCIFYDFLCIYINMWHTLKKVENGPYPIPPGLHLNINKKLYFVP